MIRPWDSSRALGAIEQEGSSAWGVLKCMRIGGCLSAPSRPQRVGGVGGSGLDPVPNALNLSQASGLATTTSACTAVHRRSETRTSGLPHRLGVGRLLFATVAFELLVALGDSLCGVAPPLWLRSGAPPLWLRLPLPPAKPRDRNTGRHPESLPSLGSDSILR